MPYAIYPFENGFRVYNIITGKPFSNHSLPYETALKQLRALHIHNKDEEDDYLKTARILAQRHGYDPKRLFYSDDNKHKLLYVTPENKVVRFGRQGYNDFILWKSQEFKGEIPKGKADEHRKNYLLRSAKIKGDWKNDIYSPNNFSRKVLWDE